MRTLAASVVAVGSLWLSVLAAEPASIGYPTVAAALDALRKDPQAHFYTRDGWTGVRAIENGNPVLWSFTPEGHPAGPAAVKRTAVYDNDGAWSVEMAVLCGGTKAACDKLVEDFKVLNLRAALRQIGSCAHPAELQTHQGQGGDYVLLRKGAKGPTPSTLKKKYGVAVGGVVSGDLGLEGFWTAPLLAEQIAALRCDPDVRLVSTSTHP